MFCKKPSGKMAMPSLAAGLIGAIGKLQKRIRSAEEKIPFVFGDWCSLPVEQLDYDIVSYSPGETRPGDISVSWLRADRAPGTESHEGRKELITGANTTQIDGPIGSPWMFQRTDKLAIHTPPSGGPRWI